VERGLSADPKEAVRGFPAAAATLAPMSERDERDAVEPLAAAQAPRRHARWILVLVVAVVAAAAAAGVAFAQTRATRLGTGVVVVETRLAYQRGQAAGTGMVLTSSGEVLTNNHVIRGATSIRVSVPGTGRSYAAKVVGYDISDDVAVLQLSGASHLKTVTLGSSAKVGQAVKAVGNAGGTGTLVSAPGVVTGIARAITVSDEQGSTARLTGLIETNAALRPGDSGGPLLNAAGRVVGMNTAASTGYGVQDMAASDGYAIPIAKAAAIAKRIEAGQASAKIHVGGTAFLGVALAPAAYGTGAAVASVVPGGPAAKARLVPGNVIVSLDGRSVTSTASLGAIVLREKPGAQVALAYVDGAGTHTVTVTLASGPPQ
jgi:S1-C subfamily serine protease